MRVEKSIKQLKRWLRVIICVSLIFNFQLSSFNTIHAQHHVDPVTDWLATVDDSTQQIVLRWRPSADSLCMGYHICSGSPCLDYDTVFGRFDTTYVCADHDPMERHSYRLHVFDSSYNVSSLTPSFGNMVLTADVPECATTVNVSWTPYEGMPSGVWRYSLLVRQEPFEDEFGEYYHTDSAGVLAYTFDIPDGSTTVHLKVLAISRTGALVSQSNRVTVVRRTVDSAAFLEIEEVAYDTLLWTVRLGLHIDTAFQAEHYTLWRSVDGSPWRELATLNPTQAHSVYEDSDLHGGGSLLCYQLSVPDACGMNENYSATRCLMVPERPDPVAWFANTLVAGDEENGTFLPSLTGWDRETYELTIYNRMGLQLFVSRDPLQGWTPERSTPQGVYAYVLHVGFLNGTLKTFTGTITLIK